MIIFASTNLLTEISDDLIYIGVMIPIGFLLCVILHETGHLVGGLLSGYAFSSFEIFGIKTVRNGHTLRISISDRPCIGQCIMKPGSMAQEPGLLILGGVIANIFTGTVFLSLLMMEFFKETVPDLDGNFLKRGFDKGICAEIFFLFFAGINLAAGLMNCLESNGTNDGHTFADSKKSSFHTEAYNRIMMIYCEMNAGKKLSEMDTGLFKFPDIYLSSLSAELSVYRFLRAREQPGGDGAEELKRLEKYPCVLLDEMEVYADGCNGKNDRYHSGSYSDDDLTGIVVDRHAGKTGHEICGKLRK